MKYPQSFIEELRNRLRVSEVVGRAVTLRRAGREYHALCPFHKEKSPSFTVNDEKGFFHCFGCGAHGDVIGFTMDYEHLGYREAVQKLAGEAGLSVPRETIAEVERENREQSLQQVLEAVCGWFEEQREATSEADFARRYIVERGLSAETVARFRIGYAPENRDALARAMKQRGISEQQLIDTGMLISIEGKAPYARFRRRLMFPIRDRKSRVIGFGGRILPGEPNSDAPKYLNSPETVLFHKGRQLFNLDIARRAALDARQLIIAEGYMDVIALAQAGINYAVAPLGTAITPEQLQLAWQLVDEPTLCLDGDSAGQRAMTRAADLALPLLVPGKTLRMAMLPKGEDPDTLLRTIGRQAFDEVMARAQPLSTVLWLQAMGDVAATPEARAAQEQALNVKVNTIKHPGVQHYYKQFIRDKLREMQQSVYQRGGRHSSERWNPSQQKGKWAPASAGMTTASGGIPPALPPIARSADATLLAPAANLLALVVAHPSILTDAGAEENWLMAPMPAAWQLQAHQAITELHINTPDLTAEDLFHTLSEELPAEAIAPIAKSMEDFGIAITVDSITRATRVARLWGQVVNDVNRARLKVDVAAAQTQMAAEMNDDNFARFMALKTQLEALERERVRFYLDDPLPSAAST
jgi:DNA primase